MGNQVEHNENQIDAQNAGKIHKDIPKGQPQGKEGDPHQNMVNRENLVTEEKELDRRPADTANGNTSEDGGATSSAIAGIQDDQKNANGEAVKPKEKDVNRAEIENKEHDGDE